MSIIIRYGLHGNDDATNGLISCVRQKTPHVRSRGNFIAPITSMICCSATRRKFNLNVLNEKHSLTFKEMDVINCTNNSFIMTGSCP